MTTSKAQQRATIKYMKENLEEIRFRVRKGEKEKISDHAASRGMSMSAYINKLIKDDMDK